MITKLFYTLHRILGTLLSILFFAWFVSGIVMIYHGFPRVGQQQKMEKLEPLPT
ncbi:MAG: PepSY domain-containing protein, partial [Bacteroidales bacterium]|nr:PepSY domain-containing protein [Bacteroidales bacterium]